MAAPITVTRQSGVSNARFAAVALLSLGAVLLGASNLSAPTNLSASHLSTGGNGPMPSGGGDGGSGSGGAGLMPTTEANVIHQAEAGTGPCHTACPMNHQGCDGCAIPCEEDVLGQACSDCQAALPSCHACFACVASHNHDDPSTLGDSDAAQNAATPAPAMHLRATSATATSEEFSMVAQGKCTSEQRI